MNYNTQNARIASITEKTFEFSNSEAVFLTFKAWDEDIAKNTEKLQ